MDFGLSPDQIEVRDAVRRLARRELPVGYLDRARSADFPWDVHRRVAQLGVLGLLVGPAHNPLDRGDHVAAGLAVEDRAHEGSSSAARRAQAGRMPRPPVPDVLTRVAGVGGERIQGDGPVVLSRGDGLRGPPGTSRRPRLATPIVYDQRYSVTRSVGQSLNRKRLRLNRSSVAHDFHASLILLHARHYLGSDDVFQQRHLSGVQ